MRFLWDVIDSFAEENADKVDEKVLRPLAEARRNGYSTGILSVSLDISIESLLEHSGYCRTFNRNLVVSNRVMMTRGSRRRWREAEPHYEGLMEDRDFEEARILLYTVAKDYRLKAERFTLDIYGKKPDVMEEKFFVEKGFSPDDTFYLGDTEDDLPVTETLPDGHFIVPFLATEGFREKASGKYGAFVPENEQDLQKYLLSA